MTRTNKDRDISKAQFLHLVNWKPCNALKDKFSEELTQLQVILRYLHERQPTLGKLYKSLYWACVAEVDRYIDYDTGLISELKNKHLKDFIPILFFINTTE